TLRRHLEAMHKAQYHEWALADSFQSKLPRDVKKSKEEERNIREQQQTLDAHLRELPKPERVVSYSDAAYRRAAIQWIAATDQPISALEHPEYQKMIQIVARANKTVPIPDRKASRAEIIAQFHEQMNALKERLKVRTLRSLLAVTMLISVTLGCEGTCQYDCRRVASR
ncbi:hypothetical protein BC835DRAFT_1284155, partial [Cytidiella melzeri]